MRMSIGGKPTRVRFSKIFFGSNFSMLLSESYTCCMEVKLNQNDCVLTSERGSHKEMLNVTKLFGDCMIVEKKNLQ